jgi:hypothetical protein
VSPSLLDDIEEIYAPPDHPVFKLVPDAFQAHAERYYEQMGDPVITSDTFWQIYQELLQKFKDHGIIDNDIILILENHHAHCTAIHEEEPVPILPGLRNLRNGDNVVGAAAVVAAPAVPDSSMLFVEPEAADFTDTDSDGQ